jgi:alkylhydroperoxidase family enzyme
MDPKDDASSPTANSSTATLGASYYNGPGDLHNSSTSAPEAAHHHGDNNYVDPATLQSLQVDQDTLFAFLQPHIIPMETIRQNGHAKILRLVQILIGIQPTANMLMAIWPPAYKSYNTLVPNLMNLPNLLLDLGTEKHLITLAAYVCSRASQCTYCSHHTCTLSLRRGSDAEKMRQISLILLQADNKNPFVRLEDAPWDSEFLSKKELAVASVAYGMGTVPCTLAQSDVDNLREVLSPPDVEWVVAIAAMFGSLNKLMDGLSVPLEPSMYAETIDLMGPDWKVGKVGQMIDESKTKHGAPTKSLDDWKLKLHVLYLGLCPPDGAIYFNRRMVQGMPTTPSGAMDFLSETLGHPFPSVFERLTHSRVISALVTVINLNFSVGNTAGLTVPRKLLAGAIFAKTVKNKTLLDDIVAVGQQFGVSKSVMDDACSG